MAFGQQHLDKENGHHEINTECRVNSHVVMKFNGHAVMEQEGYNKQSEYASTNRAFGIGGSGIVEELKQDNAV